MNFEDSLLNSLRYIEEDVAKETWTRTENDFGQIMYVCLSNENEPKINW